MKPTAREIELGRIAASNQWSQETHALFFAEYREELVRAVVDVVRDNLSEAGEAMKLYLLVEKIRGKGDAP